MKDTLDNVLDDLARIVPNAARPGKVASPEGTTPKANPYVNTDCGAPLSTDVDGLFGAAKGYLKYKTEKFEHRLMLWYRLQGYNAKETAQLTGYTPQTVSEVGKQPWFQKAFCELAAEQGKDAVQTFLEGEVLPALERTVELSKNGETDTVRLAASREILDRFLGKSVAKTEVKSTGVLDVNVYSAAKLQEEYQRNEQILKGRGIGAN